MEIEITTRSGFVPDAAKAYAKDKVSKAARIYDRIGAVHVHLEQLNEEGKMHLVAHLDSGATLVAEAQHEELRAAIDLCSDKFDRQVRREKERLIGRSRKIAGGGDGPPSARKDEHDPTYEDVIREDLDRA